MVPLEGSFEAEVIAQLGILELLEDKGEVDDQEEICLHLELVQDELEATLDKLQDEIDDPKKKDEVSFHGMQT